MTVVVRAEREEGIDGVANEGEHSISVSDPVHHFVVGHDERGDALHAKKRVE